MVSVRHSEKDFSVDARLDRDNRRVWVVDYRASCLWSLRGYLYSLAGRHRLEKIIFPVRAGDEKKIQGYGFFPEGLIRGYYGVNDAFFLSAFLTPRRAATETLAEELATVREVLSRPVQGRKKDAEGFLFRPASKGDAGPMAKLFREVFASYTGRFQALREAMLA